MFAKIRGALIGVLIVSVLCGTLAGCATTPAATSEAEEAPAEEAPAAEEPAAEEPAEEEPAEEAPAAEEATEEPAPEETPTLVVWLFQSFVPEANDALEGQIQRWGEANGVDVQVEFYTAGDQREKLVSAIEGGSTPDLAQVESIGPLRYANALLDITDVAEQVISENGGLLPGIEPYAKVGDSYLGVPQYNQLGVMYIRQDLLEAAGLEPPETWEELAEVAEQLQDPANQLYGFGQSLNPSGDAAIFAQSVMWGFGGGLFDEEGNANADTEENRAALAFMTDLIGNRGITPPGVNGWTDSSNNEAWMAGNLVMTLNGPSVFYVARNSDDQVIRDTIGANMIIRPYPAGPEGAFHLVQPYNWVVFKDSPNTELAKDLLHYLESPDQASEYLVASAGMAAPVYVNRVDDPFWETDPNYQAILDTALNGTPYGYPGPVSIAAVEVQGRYLLTNAASQVIAGQMTVDEAIQDLQVQVEEVVQSNQ